MKVRSPVKPPPAEARAKAMGVEMIPQRIIVKRAIDLAPASARPALEVF